MPRLTIVIADDTDERLRRLAKTRGVSVSSVASEAMGRYVLGERKREAGERILAIAGRSAPSTNNQPWRSSGACSQAHRAR